MQAGNVGVTGDQDFTDPQWRWPEYPPGSVVQLLVHGIGGEGPEQMTRDPHPVRVGGDDSVGFWRARNPRVPPPLDGRVTTDGEDARDVSVFREVVSWGGSTSGRSRSAFWVLLLPFALFNAAGRMVRPGASPWVVAVHQAICRLLALTMTVGVVAVTIGTVVDLVALQCGGQPLCAEAELTGRWLLAPLRWFPADAAALVALLSLLPVVAVYLLRLAGRHDLTAAPHADPADGTGQVPAQRLDDLHFWTNRWPAWRLRGIHITAGYGWAALVLALVLPHLLPDAPGWLGPATAWTAMGTLAGNGLLVLWPRVAAPAPSQLLAVPIILLRAATLVSLGLLVGTALAVQLAVLRTTPSSWLLWPAALGCVLWAAWQHVRNVTTPGDAAAGPSGATRDALMFIGVAAAAVLLDLAGEARIPTADALQTLRAATDGMQWLLAGAPAAVYGPLTWLVGLQAGLVVLLSGTSIGRTDRGGSLEPNDPVEAGMRRDRGPLPTAAAPWNLSAPVVALLSLLLVTAVGSGIHGALLDWLGERVGSYEVVMLADGRLDADAATAEAETDATGVAAPTEDGQPAAQDNASRLSDPVRRTVAPRDFVLLAQPWWKAWTALVVALTILVAASVGLWSWKRVKGDPPPLGQVTGALARSLPDDDRGPDDEDPGLAPARTALLEQASQSWLHRVLTERSGEALLLAVAIPTIIVVAGTAAVLVRQEALPPPPFASFWVLLLALLPAAAVAAVRTAREDRAARREFARIWDVLAFWPRLTHPFSPPNYGEALVPAVVARVRALRDHGHDVVLGGHSQGSIVVVAAVLHLRHHVQAESTPPSPDGPTPSTSRPPDGEDRAAQVHLVTYGSPVRLLYEGFFPHVFGGEQGAIARAAPTSTADRLPATWHNVLSLSEPISTPLWRWSIDQTVLDRDQDGFGSWDVLRALPWRDCPVCHWSRVGDDDGREPPARTLAVDVTITDPDRLVSRAGEVDGVVAGHSSYHRSRELDLHLHHLAWHAATR